MNTSLVKSIAFGVLFGALAYALPFFLLKGLLFFLVIGALFRFCAWHRFGGGYGGGYMHIVFADGIRKMSDEEYAEFKTRFLNSSHHSCGYGDTSKKETN